jgi:mRNA interferase RelE/StbE
MTGWDLQFTPRARRNLKKLDPVTARPITSALVRLASLDDPTDPCNALNGPLTGPWRLRVGDHRIILDIDRGRLVLLTVEIDHRHAID